MKVRLLVISAIFAGAAAHAQDRQAYPYIACGWDEAKARSSSNDSVDAIIARAKPKCLPLLAKNTENVVDRMIASNAGSAKPISALPRDTLRGIVRPKLMAEFESVIRHNVAVLRGQR